MPGKRTDELAPLVTPALARSCSSTSSPTNSSTRSSRVASPAVPPYSSTTIASCKPFARRSTIKVSSLMVSGTLSASSMMAETGTSSRFSRGTAAACFKCATPMMSSEVPSEIGKREWPVFIDASISFASESSLSRVCIRGRGVITSAATS